MTGVGTLVSGGYTAGTPYAVTYAPVLNDVFALAVDLDAGKIWIAYNGSWTTGLGAEERDPVTGVNQVANHCQFVLATTGALFPAMSISSTTAGVWTLQPTAASQTYAPPAGFSAWDSAAPTHSPQALAYLARTVGGNEGGNGTNIATLIDGLVSDGVWSKLDALYVLAQQNATDAVLNLVGTNYPLTKGGPGTLTFTSYAGFSGFGSSDAFFG